jgi:hypothetical protein
MGTVTQLKAADGHTYKPTAPNRRGSRKAA